MQCPGNTISFDPQTCLCSNRPGWLAMKDGAPPWLCHLLAVQPWAGPNLVMCLKMGTVGLPCPPHTMVFCSAIIKAPAAIDINTQNQQIWPLSCIRQCQGAPAWYGRQMSEQMRATKFGSYSGRLRALWVGRGRLIEKQVCVQMGILEKSLYKEITLSS